MGEVVAFERSPWNYDFTDAPRTGFTEIIVIVKDRAKVWTRFGLDSPVAAMFWDNGTSRLDGVGEPLPENIGWTTGGCGRFPDDVLECWMPLPDQRR